MIFKYLTLNIWFGGELWDQALAFLKKENPDILAIQEAYQKDDPSLPVNYRTVSELKKELDYKYVFFAPEFLHKRKTVKVDMGNVIFSRFPIISKNVVFFNQPYGECDTEDSSIVPFVPRNIQHAKIDLNGVVLNIFNTHGIWGEEGSDNPNRLKMSQIIVDQIKGKENVILSGDFNVNQGTKSIKNIEKYLQNIFKDELKTSFNMKRKPKVSGYGEAVVDNIFITPDLRIIKHYCPNVDISDHFPLIATFEV